MIELYNLTNGENWYDNTNWLSEEPIENWFGIEVWGNGRIKEISLFENNLDGTLPSSFAIIDEIEFIDLSFNLLTGYLADDIWSLENLRYLFLYENSLSFTIDEKILQLSSIIMLDLSYNDASGEIPTNIGSLINIDILGLIGCSLTGEIPESIGDLEFLSGLNLSENSLSGEIPNSFWNLSNLQYLDLSYNNLTGEIPAEIGNLNMLFSLSLGSNSFYGELPNELFQISLMDISLHSNNFSGEILHDIVLANPYIWEFDISFNYFTGNIPQFIGDFEEIHWLDISYNNFLGEVPESLWTINSLESINLGGNYLTGNLPFSVGGLTNLFELDLKFNFFEGEIPEGIWGLENLLVLNLWDNNFSGEISENIGNLLNVYHLDLSGNQLTGAVPASLSNLEYLESLYLERNFLNFANDDCSDITVSGPFWINNNSFTYEDLLNLPSATNIDPQRIIQLDTSFHLLNTAPINYQLLFDLQIENNTYYWYRDGEYFNSNTDGTLEIIEELDGQEHYYYAEITNSNFPDMFLVTDSIHVLTANECGIVAEFNYNNIDCQEIQFFDATNTNGSGIVSWLWSFDDPDSGSNNQSTLQNPVHTFITNKTEFNVKLITEDNNNCRDTIVKNVSPYLPSTISGYVTYSDTNIVRDGYVLAYLLSDGVISTKVDSVKIEDDGRYYLNNVQTCVDYIITAIPNSETYTNIMPRWHYDAFYWFDATPISIEFDEIIVHNIDIDLFDFTPNIIGSSSISGGVYYTSYKGEPVKNIDVILEYDAPEEKEDIVVGHKITNETGEWSFAELGEGEFKIKIDIPGLEMDSVYTVSINEPNTLITNLNYYVDTNRGIITEQTGIEEISNNAFSVSIIPNPNNGQFLIEIQNNTGAKNVIKQIEIFSIDGIPQRNFQIKEIIKDQFDYRINMSNLKSGVYIIKVLTKESQTIKKFIVE